MPGTQAPHPQIYLHQHHSPPSAQANTYNLQPLHHISNNRHRARARSRHLRRDGSSDARHISNHGCAANQAAAVGEAANWMVSATISLLATMSVALRVVRLLGEALARAARDVVTVERNMVSGWREWFGGGSELVEVKIVKKWNWGLLDTVLPTTLRYIFIRASSRCVPTCFFIPKAPSLTGRGIVLRSASLLGGKCLGAGRSKDALTHRQTEIDPLRRRSCSLCLRCWSREAACG
jgi:hypothetical protein